MHVRSAILFWTFVSSALSQTYTISTIAGLALPINIPGTSASLSFGGPRYLAADPAGNVFFIYRNSILRLDAVSGILTLAAGNGTAGSGGDNGPATDAQLNVPLSVAVDSAGNLYIADAGNNRIRKVSNGVISTVAGNGTQGFSGDNGPAASAQLAFPVGVAVDGAGDLFIADLQNNSIRKVSNGVITTVAGDGTYGSNGDNGPAASAQLSGPTGLAVDGAGNLYLVDGDRVRKVSNGIITTVAGNGMPGFSGDNGPASSALLSNPKGLATDAAGNLYIADSGNNRIRRVSSGVITSVAGGGGPGFGGDGALATNAAVQSPSSVAVDAAGNLFIADVGNNRIRKVSNGVITTIAGGGLPLGDYGPATDAELGQPQGVTVDSAGDLFIADTGNDRIREVSNGVISTVAGNGMLGFSGDGGPATSAQLFAASSVAVDSVGNLYIADAGNNRIRGVSNGVINTVAGNGMQGFSGDGGLATSAQLNRPSGVAADSVGNLYIADNTRIRTVSNGVISTVAGNGMQGFSGDGGPATSAQLFAASSVAVDSVGNLYIADIERIRKVSNGVITTVAGNGTFGFSGDNGPASGAQLGGPLGVAVDSVGNLYIADAANNRIRKVSGGVITTVAGNGGFGFSGDDGPATSAELYSPQSIAVDPTGKVYVADMSHSLIRLLTPSSPPCSYSLSPAALQIPASGGNASVAIQTGDSCPWVVTGLPGWITIASASQGTGSATVTLVVAPNGPSAPLRTDISIAGVTINITQAASSVGCNYAISPGGQAFSAAGGGGTISVIASAGCLWSAASTVTWVTITGANSGSGNGAVSFQVASNVAGDRSGVITVGGLSFDVEQATASIADLTSVASMAQLAFGGSWATTFTLVNTGTSAVQARLSFFDNNGNPLPMPLVFPESGALAGPLLAATLDRTVNPGAELVIQTAPLASQQTQVGWAQLLASGNLGGFAVFQQSVGASLQEAVVPLENRSPRAFEVPFDNTGGYNTGIALANTSSQAATVPVIIRDDTGLTLQSSSIALPPLGHTSFDLGLTYQMTAGRRGTVEFDVPTGGGISVLGLRFNPTSAFSTIPALVQ